MRNLSISLYQKSAKIKEWVVIFFLSLLFYICLDITVLRPSWAGSYQLRQDDIYDFYGRFLISFLFHLVSPFLLYQQLLSSNNVKTFGQVADRCSHLTPRQIIDICDGVRIHWYDGIPFNGGCLTVNNTVDGNS